MTLLQLVLLAIVQGLTEFLPVSSSAHLILVPWVTGGQDQGPLIDLMAHFGSLLAVIVYFRKDVLAILSAGIDLLAGRKDNPASRLFLYLVVATPFSLLVGAVLFLGGYADALRNPTIIGVASIFFGIVLWVSDRFFASRGTVEDRGMSAALWIGLAQMLAFIPGTSRSGITMTAARFLGVGRYEAARFSMLLSIPLLGAMGSAALLKLLTEDATPGAPGLSEGLLVAALSAITAWIAIYLLMKLVEKIGFTPFVLYRIVLGLAILWWMGGVDIS
ncbi:Undecaprenyl-diphosphatase [hydrothermal vent metagenome]|uniref:Undecaprenyl-diphosphatase n=1 Tax=hydrothermal vent metagenome TaxID=652676 RepID=A0A3B0RWH1_9ZZZZ